MILRAMSEPTKSTPSRTITLPSGSLLSGLLLLAGFLASCSSNPKNPLTPSPPDDHSPPTSMFSVIGTPHVAVRFAATLTESPGTSTVGGMFSVTMYDSIGRRIFLNDVRLNSVPMHEEVDGLGLPSRYVLTGAELPGIAIGDTIRLDALDGGDFTPPFTYLIVPSHLTLPPSATVIHENQDLVLPFTGAVERVLLTLTDNQGKRLRVNLQLESYTGQNKIFIPARDLVGLAIGDIQVATDVLDTEVILENGQLAQDVTFETRQNRLWSLQP
jgi:hypothetical protein